MISFIIASVGRPSLARALASIELWPGDEILLVGDNLVSPNMLVRSIQCPPGNDWGSKERNYATPFARCQYIAHIDDDDEYVPGTRALMQSAIDAAPGRPTIFRMRYPNGHTLWQSQAIACGNVGTPMMLIPNMPTRLGVWAEGRDCGDFFFLNSMKWSAEEIQWRTEVIAQLGHN